MKIFEKELTIKSLIGYAETERIWLPEFQRPFVWSNEQIRLLIDSIYNDYTISSILIWEGKDELARRRIGGSLKEIKIPSISNNENIIYLLDGQQRTTTLMLCFTAKPVYQSTNYVKVQQANIFWDSAYEGDDPERRWVFDDEPIYVSDEESVELKDLSLQDIFERFSTRFVSLKHAYNWSAEFSNEILVSFNNDYKLLYEYSQKIGALEKNILSKKVNGIEQGGSLEQVLVVFERINTKNTKLSIYDIMVAKTYKKIQWAYQSKQEEKIFDLRSYFLFLNYRGSVASDYFKNFLTEDFSTTKMLIAESDLLSLISIMLQKEFKLNGILKIKTDDLLNQCKFLHDKYIELVETLQKFFGIEEAELFKFQPFLKFLASFVTHYPKLEMSHHEFIKKWFWNTLMYNRYVGSQNERIARDYKLIDENVLDLALDKMKKDNSRNFQPIVNSTLDSPSYHDAYYNKRSAQYYIAMLLLLKTRSAVDFYSGIQPTIGSTGKYKLDEHHIFPSKSKVGIEIKSRYENSKYDDLLNNIANIALITAETNRGMISNKNPSIYIPEIENQYIEKNKHSEFKAIMLSQFINDNALHALREDNFELFMYERTKEMMDQIHALCN